MINIEPIKAFSDNYIWLLTTNEGSIVIDPGESSNTIKYLENNKLNLQSILITHHHFDHTGGIEDLLNYKSVDVFGPKNDIQSINKIVKDGQTINLIGIDFQIIEIPGHTLDHIAFYSENNGDPILFCGDTLFAGGCGRVFEGTYTQMYHSLLKLKNLPETTKIYCGHEYTAANLKFAKEVEPANKDISNRYNNIMGLIQKNQPTLPTSMSEELKTNPFLRCDSEKIKNNTANELNLASSEEDIFKILREWKDNF